MRAGLPLRKNVLTPLAKGVLIQLGLMPGGSTTDKAIQSTVYGLDMTTLIISNNEMKDIMEIIKYLE